MRVGAGPTGGRVWLTFLTRVATNLPLPLDPAVIRAELDSPNPAVGLAVALVPSTD